MTTPTSLTTVQAQRAEALALARKALDKNSGGMFPAREFPAAYLPELLGVADWIITGVRLERLDEHPTHVAVHNIGSGVYQEMTRNTEPQDSMSVATTTWPTDEGEAATPEPVEPLRGLQQLVHYRRSTEDDLTACGLPWVMPAKVTYDLFAVTCPVCVAALRTESSGG